MTPLSDCMDMWPTYQLEVLRNKFCKIAVHQVGSDCFAASRFFIKFLKFYYLQAQSDLHKQETALETINKASLINPKNALCKYQKSRILIELERVQVCWNSFWSFVFKSFWSLSFNPIVSRPLRFVQNEKMD